MFIGMYKKNDIIYNNMKLIIVIMNNYISIDIFIKLIFSND